MLGELLTKNELMHARRLKMLELLYKEFKKYLKRKRTVHKELESRQIVYNFMSSILSCFLYFSTMLTWNLCMNLYSLYILLFMSYTIPPRDFCSVFLFKTSGSIFF